MSKFNNEDILGSGFHEFFWGPDETVSSEFSFPGFHGTFSRSQGMKKVLGIIRGQLRAEKPEDLYDQILWIRQYIGDGGEYTLEDNRGLKYPSVRLDRFTPTGKLLRSDAGILIQTYEVAFTWMFPFAEVTA